MKQFGLLIYFLAESDQKQKFDVKSRNCFIPGSNLLKACGQNLTRELTHRKDHYVRVPLRPYGPSRVSTGCWLLRLMVKILVNLRLNFIFYPQ